MTRSFAGYQLRQYRLILYFSILFGAFCSFSFGVSTPAAAQRGDTLSALHKDVVRINAASPISGRLAGRQDDLSPPVLFNEQGMGYSAGYRWEGPPAVGRDWQGIRRDTIYFMAYQIAAVAILYVAPEGISGWSQEDKDNYSFNKFQDNVTNPVWDNDAWWINYILHPYWGAAYYIRARERGFDRKQSFWYSVLLSTLYEYGPEALFEPVSYQDLIVTPIVGALLGEYFFSPLRDRIRAKTGELGWRDTTLLFLTDPLGVINETMDRFLGINNAAGKSELNMGYIRPLPAISDYSKILGRAANLNKNYFGLQLRVRW